MKRRKWYKYPTNRPDVNYGLIIETDMGRIFEAIFEEGCFKISQVENNKVYFKETIHQESITRWMKV